jgi:hypothetical protein
LEAACDKEEFAMRVRHIRRTAAALLVSATAMLAADTASAAITESEINDTLAQASLINRGATPFVDVGVLSLGAPVAGKGDVDVFSITLNAGEILTAVTTPISDPIEVPDTELSLVSSGGVILAADDDSGSGSIPEDPSDPTNLGSLIQFFVTTPGTYYLAVTGSGDGGLLLEGEAFGAGNHVGDHDETGSYALTLSIVLVPEPSSAAVLGLAGLAMLRRRRN